MTLNKDNKQIVEEGDFLAFPYGDKYAVLTVLRYPNSRVCYTIQDTETKQVIYAYPSSQCYGAEIIKAKANDLVRKFYNTESDEIYTEDELKAIFCDWLANDASEEEKGIYTDDFGAWVNACLTCNNGVLNEIYVRS